MVRPLFTEAPVEHYAHLNICQARVPVPFDRELVQYSEVDVKSLQQQARPESGNAIMLFILVMCAAVNHSHNACNLTGKPLPHC